MFYLHLCLCTTCMQSLKRPEEKNRSPWNWNYRWSKHLHITFPPVFLQIFPDENGTPDLRKSSQPMLLSTEPSLQSPPSANLL